VDAAVQKTFLRISRGLLVAALFFAIGGHWALLQTVAWASMIVDYSRDGALTQAVEKTFDGQHPCSICKVIAKSRQSEKKQDAAQLIKKIELFDQKAAEYVHVRAGYSLRVVVVADLDARPQAPLVPPPRLG
jgi:hypothetical protein